MLLFQVSFSPSLVSIWSSDRHGSMIFVGSRRINTIAEVIKIIAEKLCKKVVIFLIYLFIYYWVWFWWYIIIYFSHFGGIQLFNFYILVVSNYLIFTFWLYPIIYFYLYIPGTRFYCLTRILMRQFWNSFYVCLPLYIEIPQESFVFAIGSRIKYWDISKCRNFA